MSKSFTKAELAPRIYAAVDQFGLTPKQAELVLRYLYDEKTSGNKVQSSLLTYNTTNYETARHMADETLRKPTVVTYMQQLLEDADFGVEVRSRLLADIARNATKQIKHIVQRNKDNEIVSTQEITSDVAPSVRLKAIAEANRIDGTLDRTQAAVRIAEREYSAQRKRLLRDAGLE